MKTLPLEEIEQLILPFLKTYTKNTLPYPLLLRLENRLSGWNSNGTRSQSMGLLRMKKIKKHAKLSVLVNDDNITSLQAFQKLPYNAKLQIHYGQSFTNALDIFRNFLETGYNYHIIFIDLMGKTINGLELMKNIRGIEKLTNSENSNIIGIVNKEDEENFVREEKGFNKIIVRPFDENLIKKILNDLIPGAIF